MEDSPISGEELSSELTGVNKGETIFNLFIPKLKLEIIKRNTNIYKFYYIL